MKRGTTPTLKIRINGIDISTVQKIEFIFKMQQREAAKMVILKSFVKDNFNYDTENSVFSVRFTEEETRLFTPDSTVYMDTRITLDDGTIPETSIAKFNVTPTLFEEGTE